MAELTTLARPYSKAAFEYAREARQLDQWLEALTFAAAVVADSKVAHLLDSPMLTTRQKADLVIDLCGDRFDEKLKAFVVVLAENKRLSLISVIAEQFAYLKAQQEKFSAVNVVSAFALDKKTEKALAEKLKAVLTTDVSLRTEVDPTLLGGIIVRSGDQVIDASVRGRLHKLAEALGV